MTLHFGQEYLSKCIPPQLMSRLSEACCDSFYTGTVTSWPMYNGQTGEKFLNMPGFNPMRVSRRKLRALLAEGITVNYGKTLVSISRGSDRSVNATFSDGTSVAGDLVVGCDGVHSRVREALVGKDVATNTPLDIQMINACWKVPAEVAVLQRRAHPMFLIGYHPTNTQWVTAIMDVQDPEDPSTFLFQQALSWTGTPRAEDFPDQTSMIDFIKEKAALYAEPWKSAGLNVPSDLQVQVDAMEVWKPDMDWTTSPLWPHATLAGDAAHNIPPFRGQGLNNAFEDAEKIVSELVGVKNKTSTLDQAIRAYEDEMKPRTLKETEVSLMQGRMAHDWESLLNAPMFKAGMNKYLDEVGGNVETAA